MLDKRPKIRSVLGRAWRRILSAYLALRHYAVMPWAAALGHKKRVWVFGAWHGRIFGDNPKHFFLYVMKYKPEIFPVWIGADPAVLRQVRDAGGKAVMKDSWEATAYLLAAEAVFYCMSTLDLARWFSGKAFRCELWHGMPLKDLENAARHPNTPGPHDMAIATAECFRKNLSHAFGLSEDAISLCGQPRNDALFYPEPHWPFDEPKPRRVILYMPTWTHWDPALPARAASALALDPFLLETLERLEATLLISLHPNSRINVEKRSFEGRVRVLTSPVDSQDLLLSADVLITDDSSCYIDYLLLDRPIIFYLYDRPTRKNRYYYAYDEVTPGPKTADPRALALAIEAAFLKPAEYAGERARVRGLFYAHADGRSCERLFDEVCSRLASRRG